MHSFFSLSFYVVLILRQQNLSVGLSTSTPLGGKSRVKVVSAWIGIIIMILLSCTYCSTYCKTYFKLILLSHTYIKRISKSCSTPPHKVPHTYCKTSDIHKYYVVNFLCKVNQRLSAFSFRIKEIVLKNIFNKL